MDILEVWALCFKLCKLFLKDQELSLIELLGYLELPLYVDSHARKLQDLAVFRQSPDWISRLEEFEIIFSPSTGLKYELQLSTVLT